MIARVTPVPFAAIQSTHDEFVSSAEAQRTIERASRESVSGW